MTKKGYQKRLPTVLVPAPRAVPRQERVPEVQPPVQPEVQPEPREVPHEQRPAPEASSPARSTTRKVVAASVLGLVVALVAGVGLVSMLAGDEPSPEAGPRAVLTSPPPVLIGAGESYVDLSVMANGDVEATQWIVAAEPIDRLRLDLPELAGAEEITASAVIVLADGEVVAGPDRITGRGATYALDAATDVQVSYRLTGAIVFSDSVTGRALAAPGMDAAYAPRSRSETRVVRGPGLLSLACGKPPAEQLVPCGQETSPEEWSVDLTGTEVEDRVVAQLTLG
ncbi:hypothetical protein EUA06_02105 [Nocardioides glacieisoli]|uniref:Uncharacterized protein n=1 Tax=Nocardioides glacieisoli TaxID=1168730 RepID=A0A4Q2S7L1_9ACTN|nr:hypothetical protein [Nocardioides glacieisoli]RYB96389.1 hypothetical protein EUA06_02105 [Nocardioides glacieisoli]